MEAGICQGLLGFLLYACAVPLLLRLLGGAPSAIVLAAAIGCWLLSLAAFLAAGARVNLWSFSIAYAFLALCFLMAFGAIHKSISLRIAAHLAQRPDRSASGEALQREVLEESYRERLAIIAQRGWAERSGERFALTPGGARLAVAVRRLQGIFRIERSG